MSLNDSLHDIQTLLAQSRFLEAEQRLQPLLAQSPHDPVLHRTLAAIAQATGRGDMALRAMRTAAALAPQSAPLQMDLGQVLAGAGAIEEALGAFRRAIDLQPDLAPAWYFLGMTLYGAQRDAEALPALRRAHALAPQQLQIMRVLAETEYALEHHEEALARFEQIAAAMPADGAGGSDPGLFLRRSQCRRRTGAPQAAVEVVDAGLHRFPGEAALWLERGWVQEDLGDAAQAQQAYAQAHALRPDWGDPLGAAIMLGRGEAPEALVRDAEVLLANDGSPAQQRAYLHHALGKRDDSRGAYAEAARHWAAANALRRDAEGGLDRAALDAKVDAAVAAFTAETSKSWHAHASRDPRPVFVLGMPRSGTTLVEQILAAHPRAFGCGELTGIVSIANDLTGEVAKETGLRWPEDAGRIVPEWLHARARAYLEAAARMAPPDAERLVDKQPYNFLHVGLIGMLFADAKIVWCRRDPRDIALSIYSESFSPMATYATSLDDIRRMIEGQERLMRHWQAVSPLPILEMRYETLVGDLETQTRRLIDFVGLDWDPVCLDFHNSGRSVQTLSRWQVRQPVHTRSVGRWRNYAEWFAGWMVD